MYEVAWLRWMTHVDPAGEVVGIVGSVGCFRQVVKLLGSTPWLPHGRGTLKDSGHGGVEERRGGGIRLEDTEELMLKMRLGERTWRGECAEQRRGASESGNVCLLVFHYLHMICFVNRYLVGTWELSIRRHLLRCAELHVFASLRFSGRSWFTT